MKFWDYDIAATLRCESCGWTGTSDGNEEVIGDLIEVRCNQCHTILLVVPFPTFAETRDAAAAGNQRAITSLGEMERQEAEFKRRQSIPRLTDPAQLPELPGERLHIVWDIIDADNDRWHQLTHHGVEVWREPAQYEFHQRYREVFVIVHQRYGDCLASMHPTEGANYWLVGDSLSAATIPASLNATLTHPASQHE